MSRGVAFWTGLLALIISTHCAAEPVNLETAEQAAKGFLAHMKTEREIYQTLGKTVPDSIAGYQVGVVEPFIDDISCEPIAYIAHLTPKGYVAVSADTEIKPVIAYSFTSIFNFDSNPNNTLYHMLMWDMRGRLRRIASPEAPDGSDNTEEWIGFLLAGDGDIPLGSPPSPLAEQWPADDDTGWVDTEWGQTEPYYDRCPVESTKPVVRCLTGCVATAMAQICNYWRYPNSVQFQLEDNYTTETLGLYVKARDASFSFPWPNLGPDSIAKLMFAAGVSVHMDYSSTFSGAYHGYLPDATPLAYNATWAYTNRWRFTSADYMSPLDPEAETPAPNADVYGQVYEGNFWTILRTNMQSGHPAQLGIVIPDVGGHSIVCDGYRDSGSYHLNFGWDGSSDGWYDQSEFEYHEEAEFYVVDAVVNISPRAGMLSMTLTGSGKVSINDGTPVDLPYSMEFYPSEPIRVKALPGLGRLFGSWSGDNESTQEEIWPYGDEIDITANFVEDTNDDDNDGSTNFEEAIAGTDPGNPSSLFQCTGTSGGEESVTITWSSVTGKSYAVYFCDGVFGPDAIWTLAEDGIAASGTGTNSWTDDGSSTGTPPASSGQRYYRVEVLE